MIVAAGRGDRLGSLRVLLPRAMYMPDLPRQVVSWFEWRWVVWIGYLIAAAVAAVLAYRGADTVERRRIGVMLLGGGLGAVAGGPIALTYWRSSETGLFASPAVGFATLLLLVVPLVVRLRDPPPPALRRSVDHQAGCPLRACAPPADFHRPARPPGTG